MKTRKKREEKTSVVEQWIEIEVKDNLTVTTRYPGEDEMKTLIEDKRENTGRDVELIYRRLNFVDGVPDQYHWTTSDPVKRQYGGFALQRLRLEDWFHIIEEEAGGHLIASPFHMPRPESRGGCECQACQNFEKRLEKNGR